MCLQQDIFPDSHKCAIVRPWLKKPSLDPSDIKSFGPISNLSFLSKVAERLVVNRFNKHADLYHLLPPRQSAYWQHHSTETAITIVHNDIVHVIDAGEMSVLVLLDPSAAFVTVNHDVILDVLQKRFGVKCCALDWFRSYLSNRTQSFCDTSEQSAPVNLPCSVPQGSRIGSQEFIVYMEDIAETIAAFSLTHHLFADDTQLQKNLRIVDIKTTRVNLELCCSSQRLVLIKTATAQWWQDRADMVQLVIKSKEADASRYQFSTRSNYHWASSCCPEPRRLYMDSELNMRIHIDKVAAICFFRLLWRHRQCSDSCLHS